MSVMTSSTKDVSVEVRSHVYDARGERGASDAWNETMVAASAPKKKRARTSTASLLATQRTLTLAPPGVLAVVILVGWYMSTNVARVSSLFLPAPGDVVTSLSNGLSNGLFLSNAWVTIQESLLGFLLALVIALPVGYGIAKSRLLAAALQPYIAAGQSIPAIVIAPLLVLWFGYSTVPSVPIVVLCMLVVLFPLIVTTILGMQTIDTNLTDAARVEGASGWSLLSAIEFPLALPAILAGVRTSLTLSITGAIVGEFVVSGDSGLGSLVLLAREQYDTALLFATLVVLAVLAALYYGFSGLLMRLAQAIY